jgi:hypothetical protein
MCCAFALDALLPPSGIKESIFGPLKHKEDTMQLRAVVKDHMASRKPAGIGINMIEKTLAVAVDPLRVIPQN